MSTDEVMRKTLTLAQGELGNYKKITSTEMRPDGAEAMMDAQYIGQLEEKLAATQARIAELRDALIQVNDDFELCSPMKAVTALSRTDDLSALEAVKAQARREALMEALAQWEAPWNGVPYIDWLRRMVGEVKP